MIIQEPVQAAIWQCLNHYDYADSIFLAERLYAEVGSDEALFTLATCYFRAGKPLRTYMLLQSKGCPNAQCRFLFAQACFSCDKYAETESALTGSFLRGSVNTDDIVTEFGDMACFALRLLALVYTRTEQTSKAIECYQKSLKLNPFLWSSFESLCHIGDRPDPSLVFQVNSQSLTTLCQSVSHSPAVPNIEMSGNQSSSVAALDSSIHDLITSGTRQQQQSVPQSRNCTPFMTSDLLSLPNLNTIDSSGLSSPAAYEDVSFLSGAPAVIKSRPPMAGGLHAPGYFLAGGPMGLSPLTPSFGVLPLELTPTPTYNSSTSIKATSRVGHLNVVGGGAVVTTVTNSTSSQQQQHGSSVNHPKPLFSQTSNTNTVSTASPQGSYPSNIGLRRSSRLFGNRLSSSSSVKENNKNQGENRSSVINTRLAGGRKPKGKLTWTPQQLNEKNKADNGGSVGGGGGNKEVNSGGVSEGGKIQTGTVNASNVQVVQLQRQSANGLMQLLQDLGRGYEALSRFDCNAAIDHFNSLAPHHFNTGWVLAQVGRAYFEMSNYHKAEKVYNELMDRERYRTEGMEVFSTVLWHLQHDVQLSRLSQHLTDLDKTAPEAWCATGNCFSLQKEHDIAIRYFQRAIQVDPSFAYAYTLLGHEYVLIEELDKALSSFRNAVRIDPHHYNAWYGIGMVCYKQEKFSLAEFHFSKALSINPNSCALLCHLGVAQHTQKKSEQALQTLSRAMELDPRNPLCKFHRASVLFSIEQHEAALKELEELRDIVPKESLVYFLMGKVHKKLGNTDLSLVNFSWAMDLDPKGTNNHIKEAIDRRYMSDEDDTSFVMSADGAILTRNGSDERGGADEDVLAVVGGALMNEGGAGGGAQNNNGDDFINTDYFQPRSIDSDDSL